MISAVDVVRAIGEMQVPDLSHLIFDGKGEIELNRRLCLAFNKLGMHSRVEYSVPEAKGPRTHTDVVLFDASETRAVACIECKACITPDVVTNSTLNNNFERAAEDIAKYAAGNAMPLFIIMWTAHWTSLPDALPECSQPKYFGLHRRLHAKPHDLREIKAAIRQAFSMANIGNSVEQVAVGPFDEWKGLQAMVIATVAQVN